MSCPLGGHSGLARETLFCKAVPRRGALPNMMARRHAILAMVELSVTRARENLAELIDETHRSGEPMVLTQAGRPVAVMLDHGLFERLVVAADEAKGCATRTLPRQEATGA